MAPSTSAGSSLLIIERILRNRDSIWRQIGDERDLGRLIMQMLASSAVALACYGAVLGASQYDIRQIALSAIKLPLLFMLTLAICLPTLYLFNLVFGARLQVRQALALVMVTITVTAVLALAFAPISLFFLITALNYSFYKLLSVTVLALSAFVGLKFLTAGMHALNAHTAAIAAAKHAEEFAEQQAMKKLTDGDNVAEAPVSPAPAGAPQPVQTPEPQPAAVAAPSLPTPVAPPGAPVALPAAAPVLMPNGQYATPMPQMQMPQFQPQAQVQGVPRERPASMTLLYVWILLFGFVGTQLAWTLRPFVGSPGEKFQIFRRIDGNFYVDIIRTIGQLF